MRTRDCRGFTLVEVIIATALLGLLAIGATWLWVSGLGLVRSVNLDSAAVAEGRLAMERLARELREVKYGNASAFCISTPLSASRIVFRRATVDGVYACGTNDRQVAIEPLLTSSQLLLSSSASPAVASAPLTGYVGSFAMRYLDGNYAVTTDLSLIRYIELSLTQQPSGERSAVTRMTVALRNQ